MRHHRWIHAALALGALLPFSPAGRAEELPDRSAEPYLGAIVLDAETGATLFEDHAAASGYPASIVKLMNLLLVLEQVERGALSLNDPITVAAEASTIGGSQVYLKEHEVFTVDELLYAVIVQSANDAATALALRIGGTKDGFARLMTERARELGMTATQFNSVHGLPPGPGQRPDISTARDLALLCREVLRHPDALRYTSTRERGFRNDTFVMRSHNPLLGTVEGCDGLKTGYFAKAGFSIAATAARSGRRVIAVVLGSKDKKIRNAKAAELLARGFLELAKKTAPARPTP
jgi:D-alanyl-D-alanine carboxypeptidase (penicillin-binding protein 5/6)